jgi:hypothetical protein
MIGRERAEEDEEEEGDGVTTDFTAAVEDAAAGRDLITGTPDADGVDGAVVVFGVVAADEVDDGSDDTASGFIFFASPASASRSFSISPPPPPAGGSIICGASNIPLLDVGVGVEPNRSGSTYGDWLPEAGALV